ncbi:RecB-like helicase [Arcobacter sp. FWKO B]|uniref:RecB-like helicase n=1 Tax=Arcobacter sp. FWKO B TaxID=2593672 RepID=UPI001907125A|nr:RecB-like helicase [Arcobacter sp. FWKO B]
MENFLALKASAGSGKTFALSVRYISLILLGAKPSEILTLTFTNKAANEMKERIFHTITTLGDDKAYLEQISLVSGKTIDDILLRKNDIKNEFIKSSLSIFTIDKFINKILKEFSGYLGIFDSYEIANDNIDELSFYFLSSLNDDEFSDFVEIYLQENKKLSSLITYFKSFIQKESQMNFDLRIYETTLQSIQDDILSKALKLKSYIYQTYEDALGVNSKKALDFETFDDLFNKTWIYRQTLSDFRDLKKFEDKISADLFLEIQELLKEYFEIRSNNATLQFVKLFDKFRTFRQEYIIKQRYLEFNDITNFANRLLNEIIDKEFLYFRLDARYRHILIDEFQDTSIEQFNILSPLIEESLAGSVEEFKTFFYVGDTKQSIYRFRGGKRELFDYLISSYPQIKEQNLDTNYRSKSQIVEFVNETFKSIHDYEYINQKSIDSGGFVEVYTSLALQGDEPYVDVLGKLKELKSAQVDLNKCAILVSTNEEVLNLYYYLSKSELDIPINTEMTSKLINQKNVKVLINWVKYLFFKEEIYKLNTMSLLGKNFQDDFVLEYDIQNNSVENILKTIALSFDILDENIIKLIEISSQYKDVFDFVYNIDFLDASMQNSAKTGISILTIFKSKGLEYESVILVDKLKRSSNNTDAFLFEYDGIFLKKIHYKIKNKESFDTQYKKALEKEEKLARIDILNVLYVALTRAKQNLIILKKEENSIFDEIGLSDLKLGVLSSNIPKKEEPKKSFPLEYAPLPLGTQDVAVKIGLDEYEDTRARYFGIATHYALENMVDFKDNEVDSVVDITKQRFSSYLNSDDFLDIEKRIKLLLSNSEFMNIIQNAQYLRKEQPLIFFKEMKYIDLLAVNDDGYIIIDYKTSSKHHEIYHKQVSTYKKAIEKITGSKNIKGYIFYLLADKIHHIIV